jgi:hypothetical protein
MLMFGKKIVHYLVC